MPVARFDSAQAGKAVRLDNGWVRAPATLTRTGVFPYRQADGTVRRELRSPEEVFHADAMASFEGVPLVVRHPVDVAPHGILDDQTAREVARGAVSSPHQDGDNLDATILLTDRDAVADVDAGTRELSCGYHCDVEMTPGVHPKFGPYDAVQRRIRGNHVALEPRGRAGPGARIRLDSGDAVQVVSPTEQSAKPTTPSEPHPMKKIRIDGVEYEVSEQVAQAIEKLSGAHAAKLDAADKGAESVKAEKSKAEARADAAEAKAKELQAKLDAATDPKAQAARVAARVALETKAREILGDEAKLDGSDLDVKKAVLAKTTPVVKLDGKDAAYIDAAFDFAVTSPAAKPEPRTAPYQAHTDAADVDLEKARADFAKHATEAHKKPLSAHKK